MRDFQKEISSKYKFKIINWKRIVGYEFKMNKKIMYWNDILNINFD
jgi:hypothetical protein